MSTRDDGQRHQSCSARGMRFVDGSIKLLGVGSVVIGAWGVIHPRSLTTLMGDDPELGRWLGTRDVLVGAALLEFGGPVPVALRVASDLHDAIRLRRRSPLTAFGAAGVAIWGAVLLGATLKMAMAERPPEP